MIAVLPMASKKLPWNPKTWAQQHTKLHVFIQCCPVSLLYFIPWDPGIQLFRRDLSRSVMGSSCCLDTVRQEVSLGSYRGTARAKPPRRRAGSPLRLLAPRSLFEQNEMVMIYISGKKLHFWRNQTLLCEVSSTEGAKYYATGILLLFFSKKREKNIQLFVRCAEHTLN